MLKKFFRKKKKWYQLETWNYMKNGSVAIENEHSEGKEKLFMFLIYVYCIYMFMFLFMYIVNSRESIKIQIDMLKEKRN